MGRGGNTTYMEKIILCSDFSHHASVHDEKIVITFPDYPQTLSHNHKTQVRGLPVTALISNNTPTMNY